MTVKQLADALKPFDIGPKKFRSGRFTHRGYAADDFGPVFAAYFPEALGIAEQEERAEHVEQEEPVLRVVSPNEGPEVPSDDMAKWAEDMFPDGPWRLSDTKQKAA